LKRETVLIAIPEPHSRRDYTHRVLPQYVRAIEQAGGEAMVVPLDVPNEEIARLVTLAAGILLPGSPADVDPQKYGAAERHPQTAAADPRRDNADELLLQDAYNLRKPILAICYGLQSLNVWRTGTLVQHLEETPVQHNARAKGGRAHMVRIDPVSRLAELLTAETQRRRDIQEDRPLETRNPKLETFFVNSSHHQAVQTPGDGLRIAARCPEDGVIEALEGTAEDHFVLGVQWHPERLVDDDATARTLFRALVETARNR
jgi:putative glutamine amidotransferase